MVGETIADNGMVAARRAPAAEMGVEILEKGGNAVDAAVATSFALTVVEPYMSGIGGSGGFMLIYLAETEETGILDYNMVTPMKATPEMFELKPEGGVTGVGTPLAKDNANILGYRSIGVPGTVAGLCKALERYGTMDLEEVMAPAIRFARQGCKVSWYISSVISTSLRAISMFPETARIFLKDGSPPSPTYPADILIQKDLAETLEKIARNGPEAFYRGEIASAIVEDIEKNGGLLTAEDLARFEPRFLTPSPGAYRDFDVVYTPTSCGGPTVMEIFNILEGFDLRDLGHNTPQKYHILSEAMALAFEDRFKFMADTRFMDVPLEMLTSKEHAENRRGEIDPKQARLIAKSEDAGRSGQSGNTTHLSVVDKNRNMVSLTTTHGSPFGSKVVIPGTGVSMNNCMMWFDIRPRLPNSVGPGKKPLANMTPHLVLREGKPFMTLGAPGGRRVITSPVQLVVNVVDHGMDMQEAIDAPRIHREVGEIIADSRIPRETCDALRAMGHEVVSVSRSEYNFGRPVGIIIDPRDGRLHGGADRGTLGPYGIDARAVGY